MIATIEPEDNEFRLKGWLVPGEPQDWKDVNNWKSLLNGNQTESGIKCSLSQVENIIDRFIKECCQALPKNGINKLTIEIFLPMDLLDTEVEWWNMTDYDNQKKRPIGTMFPVRLRSVERLYDGYLNLYRSKWRENWQKAKSVLKQQPNREDFGHFDLMEDESFTEDDLIGKLNKKIGLKSTSCPPKHKRKDLFNAILRSALPIALWTRYNCHNRHKEIEELFYLQPLSCLCDSIKDKRIYVMGKKDDKKNYLGYNLAILWENPDRLPPDGMIELSAPGQ